MTFAAFATQHMAELNIQILGTESGGQLLFFSLHCPRSSINAVPGLTLVSFSLIWHKFIPLTTVNEREIKVRHLVL